MYLDIFSNRFYFHDPIYYGEKRLKYEYYRRVAIEYVYYMVSCNMHWPIYFGCCLISDIL